MHLAYRWVALWIGMGCVAGCSMSLEPAYPSIHSRYLLLQDPELPMGWSEDPPCDAVCDAEQEPGHATQIFSRRTLPGLLVQDVYAHRTSAEAEQHFNYYRSVQSQTPDPPNSTFVSTSEITFRSRYAQQESIGCGIAHFYACSVLLRYHNYMIEFFIPVATPSDPDGMNFQQINQVLQAVDDRIGRCLIAPAATPPC